MGVRIREKKPGEWWIFVHHDGKRVSSKVGSLEAAQTAASQIEAKLTLNEFSIETKEQRAARKKQEEEREAEKKKVSPTYKEIATLWLEDHVRRLNRPSTYERYQGGLKTIFKSIGEIPIDQVSRSDIKKLLTKHYSEGHTKSSVCTLKDICNGAFVFAVDEGLILTSPVTGVAKRINMKREKAKHDPLTHEEVQTFLESCQEYYPEHYPFFLLLFRTGVRLGEAIALTWDDVDFHGRFIVVSKSYRRLKVAKTKTEKTRRVDMSNQLSEVLQKLFHKRQRDALAMGRGDKVVDLVFHRKGRIIEQNYLRRIFKRILQKAGIRGIRVHDARHTVSTLLLTDGVSPVFVKELLGHSSIQMTVDIYGHLIPNSNRDAVNRLDSTPQTAPDRTPDAPYQKDRAQVIDFLEMVPKRGLEPLQAFAY